MSRKTMLSKAWILNPLVVLLLVGLLVASCSPASRQSVQPPTAAPAAAPLPPSVSAPAPGPLLVADFDNCTGTNNLGGPMGAAFNAPDSLRESYPQEANRGCIARLEYKITGWSAFWMKLQVADLRPYSKLDFDVRGDPQPGIPGPMKLELKRAGQVSIKYVSGIGADWKTIGVKLADFGSAGYGAPVSLWQGLDELVFTFEANKSGREGVVYLDHIVFER
jgi:hypothetical protein